MTTFPSPSPSPSSRPFPPPCWSQPETASLIDAYRDKWYSLRRGNLRAADWQEVADDVANRSPANPPKTSTQCRHKMEKLRKRYRSEIQRLKCRRNPSSWVHFKQMDSMENGSKSSDHAIDQDEDKESEDRDCYNQDGLLLHPASNQRFRNLIEPGIKIPGRVKLAGTGLNWVKSDYGPGVGMGVVGSVNDPVKEMTAAINKLGDGFVRIERMKMEMVKEVESIRLEMEMKRTEMIINSHRRLADSFSNTMKKKLKRMPAVERIL